MEEYNETLEDFEIDLPGEVFDIEDCEEISEETCPVCAGPGFPLGTLGILVWYRCQNCGSEFYKG